MSFRYVCKFWWYIPKYRWSFHNKLYFIVPFQGKMLQCLYRSIRCSNFCRSQFLVEELCPHSTGSKPYLNQERLFFGLCIYVGGINSVEAGVCIHRFKKKLWVMLILIIVTEYSNRRILKPIANNTYVVPHSIGVNSQLKLIWDKWLASIWKRYLFCINRAAHYLFMCCDPILLINFNFLWFGNWTYFIDK